MDSSLNTGVLLLWLLLMVCGKVFRSLMSLLEDLNGEVAVLEDVVEMLLVPIECPSVYLLYLVMLA